MSGSTQRLTAVSITMVHSKASFPCHSQTGAILLSVVGLLIGLMSMALWVSYAVMLSELKIHQHEMRLAHTMVAMQNEVTALTEQLRTTDDWTNLPTENSTITASEFSGKNGYPITLFSIVVKSDTHPLVIRQQFVRYSALYTLPMSGRLIEHNSTLLSVLFNQDLVSFNPLYFVSPSVMTDCKSIPTGQIIWVNGDCEIPAGNTLGSLKSPILIIIKNGSFAVNSGAKVFGLVVMYEGENNALLPPLRSVRVYPDAIFYGALISDFALQAKLQGDVRFDNSLLVTLQRSAALHKIQPVPGSWHDFN